MDFSERVLRITERIPAGRVSTYGELAKALGGVGFSRAVGMALSKNPHPVTVPCHRVVRSDGRIGGYSRGVAEKIRLLSKEGVIVEKSRVCDFEKKLITVCELLRP
jgi:methylated-DNA-[protein]-cysteine S-methyltransferase